MNKNNFVKGFVLIAATVIAGKAWAYTHEFNNATPNKFQIEVAVAGWYNKTGVLEPNQKGLTIPVTGAYCTKEIRIINTDSGQQMTISPNPNRPSCSGWKVDIFKRGSGVDFIANKR